jgi:hypothetical protein
VDPRAQRLALSTPLSSRSGPLGRRCVRFQRGPDAAAVDGLKSGFVELLPKGVEHGCPRVGRSVAGKTVGTLRQAPRPSLGFGRASWRARVGSLISRASLWTSTQAKSWSSDRRGRRRGVGGGLQLDLEESRPHARQMPQRDPTSGRPPQAHHGRGGPDCEEICLSGTVSELAPSGRRSAPRAAKVMGGDRHVVDDW